MKAHPVDVHVGKRLRLRRSMIGMSQDKLAKEVGVTFQQVQKYEKGVNRVGSSRLYDFSKVLSVPIGYFFEEFEGEVPSKFAAGFAESSLEDVDADVANSKETLNLIRAYYRIKDPSVRKKVLSLIKAMSMEQGE